MNKPIIILSVVFILGILSFSIYKANNNKYQINSSDSTSGTDSTNNPEKLEGSCKFSQYNISFNQAANWKCSEMSGSFEAYNLEKDILFRIYDDPRFYTDLPCVKSDESDSNSRNTLYKSLRYDTYYCQNKSTKIVFSASGVIEMGQTNPLYIDILKGQGDVEGLSKQNLLDVQSLMMSTNFEGTSGDQSTYIYK